MLLLLISSDLVHAWAWGIFFSSSQTFVWFQCIAPERRKAPCPYTSTPTQWPAPVLGKSVCATFMCFLMGASISPPLPTIVVNDGRACAMGCGPSLVVPHIKLSLMPMTEVVRFMVGVRKFTSPSVCMLRRLRILWIIQMCMQNWETLFTPDPPPPRPLSPSKNWLLGLDPQWVNHHEQGCLIKRRCGRHIPPPPFWGHSRRIPQGMLPDVQPLVNPHFGRENDPPKNFSILTPLPPPVSGYSFFGGWGEGGVGCQIFFAYCGSCVWI